MDILLLNWKDVKNPEAGGAEIIAFEFAKRLVRDGHSVTFFTSKFKDCLSEEKLDDVKVIRRGSIYTVYFYAFLYYIGLSLKPDKVLEMINTICWHTWAYVPRKKRVAYLNQLANEVWFYEFPKVFAAIGYIFERLEYLPYKKTKFLCYSESTKQDLINFGIEAKKINLFPLGLDHDRYFTRNKFIDPTFVFIARLVKMKRPFLCIDAFKKILMLYPRAKLFIVGNGVEEERIENIINRKLSKNIILVNKNNFYLKKNSKDTKVLLMQKAWALLLPSVKEGWGMVVTEAAACGTPSVVSDVTGLRDSVRHNSTGIIISSNPTSQELAQAMLKIIEYPSFRIKLSKNAVAFAKQFSWDKSYRKFKSYLIR